MDQEFSLDQLMEAGGQPDGGGNTTQAEPEFTYDELLRQGGEDYTPSPLGSAVRRGLMEAPAGAAGAAVGLAAAAPGAAAGANMGLAVAPFLGPAAPLAPIVGAGIGGLATGLLPAMGAGMATHAAQEWLLDHLGLRSGTGQLSRAQERADRDVNPWSTFTGEVGGNIATGFGVGAGRMVGQRILGAGLQGGMEAGSELARGEDVSPGKIAIAGAAGAAFPKPRGWVERVTAPVTNRFGQGGGQAQPPAGGVTMSGSPFGPGPQSPRGGAGLTGEVIPPERSATPHDADIQFATQQRDGFPPGGPMWNFWNEHIIDLQARANGKASPYSEEDAHLGPASQDHPFSYSDSDRANDVTTVARGVAADNPPVPLITEAGNPVGAPMQGRIAQRPNGIGRDYRKGLPAPRPETPGAESTAVSTGLVHEDIMAALAPDEAPLGGEGGPGGMPSQRELHGQMPDADTISRGLEEHAVPKHIWGDEPPAAPARKIQPGKGYEDYNFDPVPRNTPEEIGNLTRGLGNDDANMGKTMLREPERRPVARSPQDQKVIDTAKQQLQERGMPAVVEAIDKLPAEQQAQMYTKALYALQSKNLENAGAKVATGTEGEVRLPEKRQTLKSGVMARSKGDLARKQGVLDAYDKAVSEFGTAKPNEERGALLDRVTKMVRRADELAKGETYRPNVKPPSWQVINAARKVLSKPTPANIKAYQTAEAALAGDRTQALESSPDFQATERIEGDIANRPHLSDDVAGAISERARREQSEQERPVHEPFDNSAGEESAVEAASQNRLRDWLNTISDDSYKALANAHEGDLATSINTTQDARATMHDLMQELADIQKKRPGVIETVPGEQGAVAKRTQVKTAADLPRQVGAGSNARVIDKNSPEFKKLAEQAMARMQKEQAKKGLEITAPRDEAPPPPPKKGRKDLVDLFNEKPIDGSEKAAWEQFSRMMSDESGAVALDKWAQDAYDWMKNGYKNLFSTRPANAIRDYADGLGGQFSRLRNMIAEFRGMLLANTRAARYRDGTEPTAAEYGRIYRAHEAREIHTLPQRDRELYQTYVKPLIDMYGPIYDKYREVMVRLKLSGWEQLPVRGDNGAGFMQWMPRIQKGTRYWDKANEDFDPLTGKSFTITPGTSKMREYFTLQNSKGDRLVIVPGDGGEFTILRNGAPTTVMHRPGFDPARVGDTIKLKTKGTTDIWTVDHAGIDEITRAAGRNPDGTWKVQYHDNPVLAATNALNEIKSAYERVKLLDQLISSPEFKANSTRNPAKARENGWTDTKFPQLEGTYMPKFIAWVLDDAVERGFGTGGNRAALALDSLAQNSAKIFFTFGAPIHVQNIFDTWAIGRGTRWITPTGWRSLVENGLKGWKAANSLNDPLRVEAINAGLNPMRMHTVTANFMGKVVDALHIDVQKNLPKWDPIARVFDISSKDLLKAMYEFSTEKMWLLTDAMAFQRYFEQREFGNSAVWEHMVGIKKGMTPQEAAKSVHEFVASYDMPTTVGKSIGIEGSDAGRLVQKFLSDGKLSLFGAFHYDLMKTLGHMMRNLAGPDATKAQRAEAAAQWAVLAGMMYVVVPQLGTLWQKVTNNPDAEYDARGITRVVDLLRKWATGKDKNLADIMRQVWSPSLPVDTAIREIQNKDFTGKDIWQTQNLFEGRNAAIQAARQGEFLLGQFASPFKALERESMQPGADAVDILRKFVELNLGFKTPSPGALKHKAQLQQQQLREQRASSRRPTGWLEKLVAP